jgi:hypothetical protein
VRLTLCAGVVHRPEAPVQTSVVGAGTIGVFDDVGRRLGACVTVSHDSCLSWLSRGCV